MSVCAQCGRPIWHYIHSPKHPSNTTHQPGMGQPHEYVVPKEPLVVPVFQRPEYTWKSLLADLIVVSIAWAGLLFVMSLINSVGH